MQWILLAESLSRQFMRVFDDSSLLEKSLILAFRLKVIRKITD